MWLYHIRFSSQKETFEKIGITSRSPQERFSSQFYKGFELKILFLKSGEPSDIRALETYYIDFFKEHKYVPLDKNFKGKTECFEPHCINIKNSNKGAFC
jgi:hypothetical protein